MVVRVNWLTLCQGCRAVFWTHYCFSATRQSFFPFWKISRSVNDSTLVAGVPSAGIGVTCFSFRLFRQLGNVIVTNSPIRDISNVSEWCDIWGMKLNASKTKTMIVSRSHTMHPQSPPLTIGRTVLKKSDDLDI